VYYTQVKGSETGIFSQQKWRARHKSHCLQPIAKSGARQENLFLLLYVSKSFCSSMTIRETEIPYFQNAGKRGSEFV